MEIFDKLGIELYDITSRRRWDEFSSETRDEIILKSRCRAKSREEIRRKTLEATTLSGKALNQHLAVQISKSRADEMARELEHHIIHMEKYLAPGDRLSPYALMKRLNAEGVRPPRADNWSLNGAKRLIARLRPG